MILSRRASTLYAEMQTQEDTPGMHHMFFYATYFTNRRFIDDITIDSIANELVGSRSILPTGCHLPVNLGDLDMATTHVLFSNRRLRG